MVDADDDFGSGQIFFDFDVMSSPLSQPSSYDFIQSNASRTSDLPNFGDGFELELFSVPSPKRPSTPDLKLGNISVKLNESDPIHNKSDKPCVFKPFASFDSIELTVQSLRTRIASNLKRSTSMPIAFNFDL